MILPGDPDKRPAQLSCPTCGRKTPVSNAPYLPFCSERCRLIDLGRWLEESNSIPADSQEDDEDTGEIESGRSFPLDQTQSSDPYSESQSPRRPTRLPPGWHDA